MPWKLWILLVLYLFPHPSSSLNMVSKSGIEQFYKNDGVFNLKWIFQFILIDVIVEIMNFISVVFVFPLKSTSLSLKHGIWKWCTTCLLEQLIFQPGEIVYFILIEVSMGIINFIAILFFPIEMSVILVKIIVWYLKVGYSLFTRTTASSI